MEFNDVLKIFGIEPEQVRMVRHGYKELDTFDAFINDRPLFEAYQAFQTKDKFGNAEFIAVFAPHHGNHAFFLGFWHIDGQIQATEAPSEKLELVQRFNWPLEEQNYSYYILTPQNIANDLSQRLIIDWGGSAVTWVQRRTDKSIVSILPPESIREFESYESTILMFDELAKMTGNKVNNSTWFNALRAVNGIYVITNQRNGKNYVGSAYGKNGIWQRWEAYAENGHGGNKLIVQLLEDEPEAVNHFQFSILEILPATATIDDAIAKENLWKNKLGSRVGGYNDN